MLPHGSSPGQELGLEGRPIEMRPRGDTKRPDVGVGGLLYFYFLGNESLLL